MKQLIAIMAASLLLLSACGDEKAEPAKEPEEKTETSAEQEEKPAEEVEEVKPQEELEKVLEKKLEDKFLSLNGVFIGEEYTAQIELEGKESFSQKATVKAMKLAIRDALLTIRDSDVDASKFSNIGISVKYPLVSPDGKTSDEYVIKADFTGETVAGLDNSVNQNNIQDYASNWWEHPAVQQ